MWLSFFFLSFGFPHSATSPPLLSNEHIRHEQVRQEILNNAQLSAQIASVPAFLFFSLTLTFIVIELNSLLVFRAIQISLRPPRRPTPRGFTV